MVNDTVLRTEFSNISQRFIYKLMFNFSDFMPNEHSDVSAEAQRKFHNLLSEIITILYNKPEILNLPLSKDQASPGEANKHPEWKKDIIKLEDEITIFFAFIHQSGKTGVLEGNTLTISTARFKEVSIKGVCKKGFVVRDRYIDLMNAVGFICVKTKDEIIIKHDDSELFTAWLLLAQSTAGTYKFAYGLFVDDTKYWLRRIEKHSGLPSGFFDEYEKIAIAKGLRVSKRVGEKGNMGYGYNGNVGGFRVSYDPISTNKICFSSANGIGFKAIAERFDELDNDVKEMIIVVSKQCTYCDRCGTSGAKRKPNVKPFTVNTIFNGEKIALCPILPAVDKAWWRGNFNGDVLNTILKYLILQEKYGVNWKNKK